MTNPARFQHVNCLQRDDHAAAKLSPADQLIYRSNLLGSDPRITNTGGGNTSAKLRRARSADRQGMVEVCGSKGRAAICEPVFPTSRPCIRKSYFACSPLYAEIPESAASKRPPRIAWSVFIRHCTFNLNPRAASIDTPLHSFRSRASMSTTCTRTQSSRWPPPRRSRRN